MTSSDIERASAVIVSLLANRATDATLCPSEVARALAAENESDVWRAMMPVVHAAVDALLHHGAVKLSWKALSGQVAPGSGELLARAHAPLQTEA